MAKKTRSPQISKIDHNVRAFNPHHGPQDPRLLSGDMGCAATPDACRSPAKQGPGWARERRTKPESNKSTAFFKGALIKRYRRQSGTQQRRQVPCFNQVPGLRYSTRNKGATTGKALIDGWVCFAGEHRLPNGVRVRTSLREP